MAATASLKNRPDCVEIAAEEDEANAIKTGRSGQPRKQCTPSCQRTPRSARGRTGEILNTGRYLRGDVLRVAQQDPTQDNIL